MNVNNINETETLENENVLPEEEERYHRPTFWEKFKEIFYVVRCVACFTTIFALPSVLFIMLNGSLGVFASTLIGICVIIGWISVLFACPLKIVKVCFRIISKAFYIGRAFAGVGSMVGLAIGIGISFILIFMMPAAVAIPHYFNKLRY